MTTTKIPSITWYRQMYKLRVEYDLIDHPEISNKLGIYKDKFIKWAANQRLKYVEDIFDEYECFMKYINKSDKKIIVGG